MVSFWCCPRQPNTDRVPQLDTLFSLRLPPQLLYVTGGLVRIDPPGRLFFFFFLLPVAPQRSLKKKKKRNCPFGLVILSTFVSHNVGGLGTDLLHIAWISCLPSAPPSVLFVCYATKVAAGDSLEQKKNCSWWKCSTASQRTFWKRVCLPVTCLAWGLGGGPVLGATGIEPCRVAVVKISKKGLKNQIVIYLRTEPSQIQTNS